MISPSKGATRWTAATARASVSYKLGRPRTFSLFLHIAGGICLSGLLILTSCGSIITPFVEVAAAATPTFSPSSGNYTLAQTVTISDTTPGATIYYTTNGSAPTAASTPYTGAILVSSTETIEAIAIASGYTDSPAASATYTIALPVAATPAFSPFSGRHSSAQTVTISDTTPGATIYYTTNGTAPTAASTPYTGAISVSSTETIEAIAMAGGYANSAVGLATYTINVPGAAATPTFNPAAGTYTITQQVTLSDTTPGAMIYYTINGTTPTAGSTSYTGAISVASTETIEAIAIASGSTNSAVASATYIITNTALGSSEWTWMGGSDTGYVPGIYGTLGVFSAGSFPGGRESAITWRDSSDNLWLFGGAAATLPVAYFNDLWEFNPATQEWAWMGGGSSAGVYGTQGTASASNIPGAREGSVSWIDNSGNLWLFGGYSGSGGTNWYNDLWEFNPNTNEWTWVSGSSTPNIAGTYGVLGSPSASNVPGGRLGAASWTDSSGKFWLFGGEGYDLVRNLGYLNDLWVFDPASKEWTWMSGSNLIEVASVYGTQGVGSTGNVPGSRSSSNSWTDSSGNLWLFGGLGSYTYGAADDLNDLWEFNPATQEWSWMGGSSTFGSPGIYGALGVASPGNVPAARQLSSSWTDNSGNFWLFGGASALGNNPLNDLWLFNPTTKEWTWMSGSNTVNAPGIYGTLGVASPSNVPGAREASSSWTDRSGNLWLFGGEGVTGNFLSPLNDLWRYHP